MAKLKFITDDGQPRSWVWYSIWSIVLMGILVAGAFTDAVALRLEKLLLIYVTILPIIIGADAMKTKALIQKKTRELMLGGVERGTATETTEVEGEASPAKLRGKTKIKKLSMTEDMMGGEE